MVQITDEVRTKISLVMNHAAAFPTDLLNLMSGEGVTPEDIKKMFELTTIKLDDYTCVYAHDMMPGGLIVEHMSVIHREREITESEVEDFATAFGFGPRSTWTAYLKPGLMGLLKAANVFKLLPPVSDRTIN